MTDVPKQSKKIFRELEEIPDWSEGELNVWQFEQSVVDLYNHYKGKLSNEQQLYHACIGLVSRIGGAGVRDPVIVYLELLKSGENNKEKFIEQFKNNKEEHEELYEDFPNKLDKEFFDYSFTNLEDAGLIEMDNHILKVKDISEFDLDSLIAEGRKYHEKFMKYFFKSRGRDYT